MTYKMQKTSVQKSLQKCV